MSQSRRIFTAEFKRDALQLMQREGLSQAELARRRRSVSGIAAATRPRFPQPHHEPASDEQGVEPVLPASR